MNSQPDPTRQGATTGLPAWVPDSVVYQIFPDRFARSAAAWSGGALEPWDDPPTFHGYKGGDLDGVIERLDWIQELGANVLYFNPIFQSAANHRYHTHDYYQVDPLLGGNEAFRRLMAACRRRGMRVVLDGVFNHASRGFFAFHDILENGPKSPWWEWFQVHRWPMRAYGIRQARDYEAWFGLPALPRLNTDNPVVREYIMQVGEYWVRQGIDGWRLDVPTEITAEGFWEEFRTRMRRINPECWIVGEIWDDAAAWIAAGDRFDGTMNYLFTSAVMRFLLGDRLRPRLVDGLGYSVQPALDSNGFFEAIEHLLGLYPESAHLGNMPLLGSHDTPRLRTLANRNLALVKLATVLLLTFPGAPSIYYGDEIGLEGRRDPDCRRGFPWGRESEWSRELLDVHRTLIALRRSTPALRSAACRMIRTAHPDVTALVRGEGDGAVMVALNRGQNAASVDLKGPPDAWRLWGQGRWGRSQLKLSGRAAGIWSMAPSGANGAGE